METPYKLPNFGVSQTYENQSSTYFAPFNDRHSTDVGLFVIGCRRRFSTSPFEYGLKNAPFAFSGLYCLKCGERISRQKTRLTPLIL